MKWIKTYENFNEINPMDIEDMFIEFLDFGYELEVITDVKYPIIDRFYARFLMKAYISESDKFDAFVLKFKNNGSILEEGSISELKTTTERFERVYGLNFKTIQIGTKHYITKTNNRCPFTWLINQEIMTSPIFSDFGSYDLKEDVYLIFEKS